MFDAAKVFQVTTEVIAGLYELPVLFSERCFFDKMEQDAGSDFFDFRPFGDKVNLTLTRP